MTDQPTTDQPCPFCEINTGRAPATFVDEWTDAIAIVPLNPVVGGHTLVIPKTHVCDFADDPDVTGATARRAAQLCRALDLVHANLITSRGAEATQSVFHLHLHLVPRAKNDGLALPWHSGRTRRITQPAPAATEEPTR
ncbi:HIT domain-containing protein [Streptomyces sp900116325]|uniref:HIT family protein n=1 Tax=Streptomyces sp. 900116325 TaxID=3154295 RepID=UPI0033B211C2